MSLARVSVQSLKGGVARDIQVNLESNTVAELKRLIAARFGDSMSTSDMKLVYRAKPLVDEGATLIEVGIEAESTVHMVYRLHGGSTGEMVSKKLCSITTYLRP
jgi:hypothetical protein